jgi:1-acyl-sn-glycerol-3-phosphate acyltransferase
VTVLTSLLSWMLGFAVFGMMVAYLFIFTPIASPAGYDGVAKVLCRLLAHCFVVRVRVEGLERLDRGRNYIFLSNHVNILDGFLLFGYLPWSFRSLELEEHFSWPVYGWFTRAFGNIPVSPTGGNKAFAGLRRADRLLRNGTSLLVLPEGHRTRTGRLGSFGRGAFYIAVRTGVEMVPMVIIGAFQVLRTGSWKVRPRTVRIVVGDTFTPSECRALGAAALRDRARERMARMLGESLGRTPLRPQNENRL